MPAECTATSSELTAEEVLERWLPDFLAGRRGAAELYAPGVTVWHNIGEREEPLLAPPSAARLASATVATTRHDVRVACWSGGFLVQAVVVSQLPDGRQVRVPTCLVVTVDGGQIQRFEEYADSAAAAPLLALLRG